MEVHLRSIGTNSTVNTRAKNNRDTRLIICLHNKPSTWIPPLSWYQFYQIQALYCLLCSLGGKSFLSVSVLQTFSDLWNKRHMKGHGEKVVGLSYIRKLVYTTSFIDQEIGSWKSFFEKLIITVITMASFTACMIKVAIEEMGICLRFDLIQGHWV